MNAATVVVNNNTKSTSLHIYDCEFLLIQLCPKINMKGAHTHNFANMLWQPIRAFNLGIQHNRPGEHDGYNVTGIA